MLSVYAIEKSEIYGHGKRVVIWFSGCSLRCKGCINSHLWNKDIGKRCSVEELFKEIFSIGDFDGVTYIGGEPLEQGQDLVVLSKKLIDANKDIVLFTGYELEELAEEKLEVYNLSSVVICGRYIEKERDTGLLLRGSRNQRIVVKDKNLLQFYNQEQRQVEVEIGEDYVKFLGFPEDFTDKIKKI